MSSPIHLKRGLAGVILALALALAVPVAAQAAPVNLATVSPFVALAGTTVTNTGPSVLNGDLGVAPGTALTGFGLPAVVNGATHESDAVAAQAQSDPSREIRGVIERARERRRSGRDGLIRTGVAGVLT